MNFVSFHVPETQLTVSLKVEHINFNNWVWISRKKYLLNVLLSILNKQLNCTMCMYQLILNIWFIISVTYLGKVECKECKTLHFVEFFVERNFVVLLVDQSSTFYKHT